MSALSAKNRAEAYQVYVSDCLRAMACGLGAKISRRFYDIIHPAPVDNRSAEEIVADITARAGLKVVEKNGSDDAHGDAGD